MSTVINNFPYIVRFVFKGRVPYHMCDGENLSEPSEWCIENVGLENYNWKRHSYTAGYGYGSSMLFFYFKEEHHAVQFKLTWQDYASSGPASAAL